MGASVSVSDAEVEREFRRRTEQVKLEYVLADAARFQAAVQPTEDEIKARFEAKKDAYRIPEKRVVSYVLLDRATLQPQVAVTDRDIELYYQDHREEFRQEEEACASHILVKVKAGDAGEGHPEAEAQKIAQGLLDQVKAGGDFAALAKKSSEDQGSAQNGGDLGCFAPGRMVPEFDDAVFALQPGQVSDLVKTSFGYHVIRLASKREATVLPLAQVKERIRASVTESKVRELGEQKAQAMADALVRGKSLEEAAKAQGLTVQKSAPIARGETPPALASPTLVARVFEMKPGQAEKEGFALPQGAAFVSLAEIQPARAPELKDVREKVRADLVDEAAFEQARTAAAGGQGEGGDARPREGGGGRSPRPQGDAGPHRPRAGPRRPRHRRRPRGGGLLAPREDARATRCARPRAGPSCASSRRSPSTRPSSRSRRDRSPPRCGSRSRRSCSGRSWSRRASATRSRATRRRTAARSGRSSRHREARGAAMHVEVRQTKDVVILDLKGRLTAGLGDQILREAIDELLAEGRRRVLLNLSDVAFVDSAGVGELVAGLKTARRFGAELKLLNVGDRVYSTLDMARLLPTFETYQDEAEAIRSFGPPTA